MTCYLIGIISGVLLNERASCPNKWTDMMSAIFFLSEADTNGSPLFTYSLFGSVNGEQNNEVKAIITSCNIKISSVSGVEILCLRLRVSC
jgi:hypothetical protein